MRISRGISLTPELNALVDKAAAERFGGNGSSYIQSLIRQDHVLVSGCSAEDVDTASSETRTVSMSTRLWDMVDSAAASNGMSRSSFVRRAVEHVLGERISGGNTAVITDLTRRFLGELEAEELAKLIGESDQRFLVRDMILQLRDQLRAEDEMLAEPSPAPAGPTRNPSIPCS